MSGTATRLKSGLFWAYLEWAIVVVLLDIVGHGTFRWVKNELVPECLAEPARGRHPTRFGSPISPFSFYSRLERVAKVVYLPLYTLSLVHLLRLLVLLGKLLVADELGIHLRHESHESAACHRAASLHDAIPFGGTIIHEGTGLLRAELQILRQHAQSPHVHTVETTFPPPQPSPKRRLSSAASPIHEMHVPLKDSVFPRSGISHRALERVGLPRPPPVMLCSPDSLLLLLCAASRALDASTSELLQSHGRGSHVARARLTPLVETLRPTLALVIPFLWALKFWLWAVWFLDLAIYTPCEKRNIGIQ